MKFRQDYRINTIINKKLKTMEHEEITGMIIQSADLFVENCVISEE